MAAADKLIPTAILIANNLRGTKYSTSGTFKLPAKKYLYIKILYRIHINFFLVYMLKYKKLLIAMKLGILKWLYKTN